jgi:hypothetical protein
MSDRIENSCTLRQSDIFLPGIADFAKFLGLMRLTPCARPLMNIEAKSIDYIAELERHGRAIRESERVLDATGAAHRL